MNYHTSISEETILYARSTWWPFFPPEYRIVRTTVIHHHIAKEDPTRWGTGTGLGERETVSVHRQDMQLICSR